jgi:hypothetical protein
LTQNSAEQEEPPAEQSTVRETRPTEKPQTSFQELDDSLKSVADDVGQITELASEEKNLVAEFLTSLLKLMQPLASAMSVSASALPAEVGNVVQAYVDPTGHLALFHDDGHFELKNLAEERNRELLIVVVKDVLPKFKQLTSAQKRKVEDRIKFLAAVTKEMQRIAGAISNLVARDQK